MHNSTDVNMFSFKRLQFQFMSREGRTEGRKEGRKDIKKEGRSQNFYEFINVSHATI